MNGRRARALRRAAAREVTRLGLTGPFQLTSPRGRRSRPLTVVRNPLGWIKRRMARAARVGADWRTLAPVIGAGGADGREKR